MLVDDRWNQLADILVNYSTETGKGDRVLISMMETETFSLARAVHAAALKAGAVAHIEFQSLLLQRDLMLLGEGLQLAQSHELQNLGMEWFFRFLQEPKRMWKRYLIGNTKFFILVLKTFFKKI